MVVHILIIIILVVRGPIYKEGVTKSTMGSVFANALVKEIDLASAMCVPSKCSRWGKGSARGGEEDVLLVDGFTMYDAMTAIEVHPILSSRIICY